MSCGNKRLHGAVCVNRTAATTNKRHVKKLVGSLNKEIPCSYAVLTLVKRIKSTPPRNDCILM
ncbi:hypothetical protein PHMEG_00025082 [Phytophthora megakarya]|uniref:Uncharacterized protein n=1 Tax=Phytophthora megakarya TaxID=4795 RepID=A0A225VDM3_9STRA|nr:hypothetical protein PHMEG_00025082 [Phytophthora megakarya]